MAGFESGWSAGQDFIEGQRQRRRDKSDRKLSRAQRKVYQEDAKTAKLEREAREKFGYYSQQAEDGAASKRYYESRASEQDLSTAEGRQRQQDYLKLAKDAPSEGPLAGEFIRRSKAATRKEVAGSKTEKQKAIQEKMRSEEARHILDAMNPKLYKRKARAVVGQSEADVDSTIANTRKTNAESEEKEFNNYHADQDRLAKHRLDKVRTATAAKQAEADLNVSRKALKEIDQRIKQFGATAKDNAEYEVALESVYNSGQLLMGMTPKVEDGNVLSHFAKLKEVAASLPTGAQAGGGSRGRAADLKRTQFHETLRSHIDSFKATEKYKSALKHQANVDIAEVGMSGNSQIKETYKNADELTKGEMRVPYIVHRRLVDAGIPAGVMNDPDFNNKVMRVVPHPDPSQRYFRDSEGNFLHDEKTGKLRVRTVMLEGDVMRRLDDYIGRWKEKYTPKPIYRRNIREGEGKTPAIDWAGADTSDKPTITSEESITGAAAMFEEQHPDFERFELMTTGGEVDRVLHSLTNPEDDNLATAVRGMDEARRKEMYDKTRISKQWLDTHLDKPLPEYPAPAEDETIMPTTPTDPARAEGLSPDKIKPRFYTDPESIGGMIEDGITSVESLKLGVKEAQAEFNRSSGPSSEAVLNRAKKALREGEEAEDILLTRRIVKDYITEKDYTVVDDKVMLHFGRESYKTGRSASGKPRETKTWTSGIPEKVNQDLYMILGKRFPMNDKDSTMQTAVGKELFNLTGSAKWRSYGSGGHLGTRVTVPKKIKKLKDAANWKPKGGMSKEELNKGVRDRESANNELKAMKEKEAKLLKALDDTKMYRTLSDSLGDEISIPLARKLGIIK